MDNPPADTPAPDDGVNDAAVARSQPIDHDLLCRQCGYNLRGMTEDDDCPECGALVWRSTLKDELSHCHPDWVKMLARGSNLLLDGYIVLAVMYVVQTFMAAMDLPMTYARLLFVLSCLPIVMGVWWITTRATTDGMQGMPTRLITRWIFVAWFLLIATKAVLGESSLLLTNVLFYTCPATFALSMAALLWYISTLINRMNQPQLASGSRKLMAGFLLLFLIITTAGVTRYLDNFSIVDNIAMGLAAFVFGIFGLALFLNLMIVLAKFCRLAAKTLKQARYLWQGDLLPWKVYQAGQNERRI